MTFPVTFQLFGLRVHPHLAFELLAYAGGFQLYLHLRRRAAHNPLAPSPLPFEQNMWILVGCVFGALFGSKILATLESLNVLWPHRHDARAYLSGKTIVGGLLGGWIGIELAKHFLRITRSTGDLFVYPLIFGMALGRVGCFLTGLEDHTYGTPTTLPWAINFGDGIPRHPTQLYEIIFLLLLALVLFTQQPKLVTSGALFRLFMLAYLAMRFAIEFIKPTWKPYLGISAIQLACLAGTIVCIVQLRRTSAPGRKPETLFHGATP